jgi:hypothetical protein
MWDADDIHDSGMVIDGIDDAVVADTNAPEWTFAFELLHAVRSRLMSQRENGGVDALGL